MSSHLDMWLNIKGGPSKANINECAPEQRGHFASDSHAGSSCVSAKLLDLLKKKPYKTKRKHVDMLISSQVRLKQYDAVKGSPDGSFQMDVKLTKVNKAELLTIDNPKHARKESR